jgi:phosphoribosyl 1,2-cyclic phosphodiesterase
MFDLPLFISEPTFRTSEERLGRLEGATFFQPGHALRFGEVTIRTVPTPHDAVDGCAFVVQAEGKKLGLLTDLGHPFQELRELLPELDGVFLESNYDSNMLKAGPYPEFLKRRIRGPEGHISNREAAELLDEYCTERLSWACLAHLSENNNTPDLALATHRETVRGQFPIEVATRHRASGVFQL